MTDTQENTTVELADISEADLDAIMADKKLPEEDLEATATDAELEEALQAVEIEQAKMDAYEEQDKTADPDPDGTEELDALMEEMAPARPVKGTKKSTKKGTKKSPKSTARHAKTAIVRGNTNGEAILRDKLGKKVYELMVASSDKADKADVDAMLERLDKEMPIKVVDKIVNLFMYLDGQSELSVFSRRAFELLKKQDGRMSYEELKADYMVTYSRGTTSAQAGHLKWIVDLTGIATVEAGYVFQVDPESLIWPVLSDMLGSKSPKKAAA